MNAADGFVEPEVGINNAESEDGQNATEAEAAADE